MPAYVADDSARAAQNGAEAVTEYLILGHCNHLVHNGSSLARTVLLANPLLPHTNIHLSRRLTVSFYRTWERVDVTFRSNWRVVKSYAHAAAQRSLFRSGSFSQLRHRD
jgi:hypothetical protein